MLDFCLKSLDFDFRVVDFYFSVVDFYFKETSPDKSAKCVLPKSEVSVPPAPSITIASEVHMWFRLDVLNLWYGFVCYLNAKYGHNFISMSEISSPIVDFQEFVGICFGNYSGILREFFGIFREFFGNFRERTNLVRQSGI